MKRIAELGYKLSFPPSVTDAAFLVPGINYLMVDKPSAELVNMVHIRSDHCKGLTSSCETVMLYNWRGGGTGGG